MPFKQIYLRGYNSKLIFISQSLFKSVMPDQIVIAFTSSRLCDTKPNILKWGNKAFEWTISLVFSCLEEGNYIYKNNIINKFICTLT